MSHEEVVAFRAGDGHACNLIHVAGSRQAPKGPVLQVPTVSRCSLKTAGCPRMTSCGAGSAHAARDAACFLAQLRAPFRFR